MCVQNTFLLLYTTMFFKWVYFVTEVWGSSVSPLQCFNPVDWKEPNTAEEEGCPCFHVSFIFVLCVDLCITLIMDYSRGIG